MRMKLVILSLLAALMIGAEGALSSSRNSGEYVETCQGKFTDLISGVKMLAACRARRRRSLETLTSAKSRVRRQFGGNTPSNEPRDVLFLIDKEVGETNFQKEIAFADVLAEKLEGDVEIGETSTHVALTIFGSSSHIFHNISFPDTRNNQDFRNRLSKVTYAENKGHLVDALRAARTEVFTESGGSRVPGGSADGMIILITDGCADCPGCDSASDLQEEQKKLENAGISIVGFMVTGGTCSQIMEALMVSKCFRGLGYPNWEALEEVTENFRNLGTIDGWTKESPSCP